MAARDFELFRHVARELLYTYMCDHKGEDKIKVCGSVVSGLRETGMDVSDQVVRVIESEFENALRFVREDAARAMVESV
jgi:hypothetical protein